MINVMEDTMNVRAINKRIKNIEKRGLTSPTTFRYVSEAYDPLIIPRNQVRGGQLRTYAETIDFISKRDSISAKSAAVSFTRDEYEEILTSFNTNYGSDLYVNKIINNEKEMMKKTITKAVQYTTFNISETALKSKINSLSYNSLKRAFYNAQRRLEEEGFDSDKFYQFLLEELNNEL